MRFFIDIDGTLTIAREMWSPINPGMIDKVKALIEAGHEVIIWSTGGTAYAREFCERYHIKPFAALGKPHFIVDDNPKFHKTIVSPGEFLIRHFGAPGEPR